MKTLDASVRLLAGTFGLALTLAVPLRAGSFSTDFSSAPAGATAYGSAVVDTSGGANDNGGVLKLTAAASGFSQTGSFIIDDLDPGGRVNGFVATFNLRMGGGTAIPGDGISFNFATSLPNGAFNEDGAGSGLTITFDAYDNSASDNTEGPEFRIKANGVLIANRKISTQFRTGSGYVPVTITYTSSGTLTLVYNNLIMVSNLFVVGPLSSGARFGFGARCGGGANQDQFVDDLNITTTTVTRYYVKGQVTPFPAIGIASNSTFQVVLQDFSAAVDPSTVTMSLNGTSVTPSVSKNPNNNVTTIAYTPASPLSGNSTNRLVVTFGYSNDGAIDTVLCDFYVAATPWWSLAPGSRVYLPPDLDLSGGTTPLYRSLALNPHTNHLYVVSRTGTTSGLTVNVLDSTSGADLYAMNTTGISGGSIILLAIAVADDGSIYAANMGNPVNAATNPFKVYRWTNDLSSTPPVVVFTGDPGAAILASKRWGDTLAVRGSGASTQIILDSFNSLASALLTPSDSSLNSFTVAAYNLDYSNTGADIGRSLQFGTSNTFLLKKRSTSAAPSVTPFPIDVIRYDAAPNTLTLISTANFYGQVGPITLDLARNLAAGILFVTNTASPDRLLVYDVSNLASPLQIAQYNFPVNHLKNSHFIGQAVFGQDKIFAVDGNNGIIAVPVTPPPPTPLAIARTSTSVVLSWTNLVSAFALQSTPALVSPTWNPVMQPVTMVGTMNFVTDSIAAGPVFYRLKK